MLQSLTALRCVIIHTEMMIQLECRLKRVARSESYLTTFVGARRPPRDC